MSSPGPANASRERILGNLGLAPGQGSPAGSPAGAAGGPQGPAQGSNSGLQNGKSDAAPQSGPATTPALGADQDDDAFALLSESLARRSAQSSPQQVRTPQGEPASPARHGPIEERHDPANTWLVRVNETYVFDPIGSGGDDPNMVPGTVRVRSHDVAEPDTAGTDHTGAPDSFLVTVVAGEAMASAEPAAPVPGAPIVEVRVPG